MKTLILGTGFVGSAYARALLFLGHYPVILSRAWFNYDQLANLVQLYQPDLVINAVGYTGTTIDDCERVRGRVLSFESNVVLVRNLVASLRHTDTTLIHISTGCMFTGPGPFIETDRPNNTEPHYIRTKLQAEEEATRHKRTFIFRIRMPFNQTWSRRNLLVKLITYPEVLEGENSLTFLDEFCMRSLQLIAKAHAEPGIYHAAYPNPVNTRTIAQMLIEADLKMGPYQRYDPEKFLQDGHVQRSQAVLDARKFEETYGAPFGDPVTALRWCIDRMKESRPFSGP